MVPLPLSSPPLRDEPAPRARDEYECLLLCADVQRDRPGDRCPALRGLVLEPALSRGAYYVAGDDKTRCHLSLAGDAPMPRCVQGPEFGEVVEFPEVGGLHHRYERAAA